MKNNYSNKFSVAPMLKYTDPHCLFFYRQLTKNTLLYTEMITTQKMLHSKNLFKKKQIKNNYPIAIQLAGNNPKHIAKCAKIAYKMGFNEINLNIGCPSKHAQLGNFGVCLMHKPILVYELIKSIYFTVPIPISVKIRIGTNKKNDYQSLKNFIKKVSKNKYCIKFIIHARIADLKIQSPKKNRRIPLLNYNYVYKIKKDLPHLIIIINGGIKSILEIKQHLQNVDGVMMGREIYKNPLLLYKIETEIFSYKKNINLKKCFKKMLIYINQEEKNGNKIIHIMKHMLNIFYNHPQAKKWKLYILYCIHNKKNIFNLFKKINKIFDKKNKNFFHKY
ncbi:tRNA dihydrouridine(20/20a) synthase DusA [Buchnera aphidicola]|uniref:tRNA dihydrouridine(20/20a) synthase DusA n=1 Tax=Buchnera aphidicola TaxID=9 RepID=UPI001078ADE9|nr:tRNA dihydrouridine(20/20a) synthase DusA [Buchnera aphidicola]VFP79360.1 tRNA-dihydrouridine(20/20a) synthase [Buchnera aphidicola (Cinara curtihirsuta)]